LVATALGMLTGCSSMLETTPHELTAGIGDPRCRAGAYYLPRRLLVFQLGAPDDAGRNTLSFSASTMVSDPRLPLCLDYLNAPTADDKLVIDRTADGLLKKIFANAEDKSLEIATAVIDVFRLGAVAGGARSATTQTDGTNFFAAKFEMDPFDVPEAAAINESLKDMGYCVYVDGYTFDPKHLTPEGYCRNPRAAIVAGAPRAPVIDIDAVMSESRRGVLYRPNMPQRVVVMRNLDPPKARWRLQQTLAIEMPNAAPIFSIGVDRSFFTTRSTTLTFDSGVLKDVQLTKGSELNSAVEVPLRVAQAIVSIPTQIVQVRINRTNNEEALIAAQAKLLGTLRDFRNEQKLLTQAQKDLTAAGGARAFCLAQGLSDPSPEYSRCMAGLPPLPVTPVLPVPPPTP
jgi:hypothetical protein